jgi:dGTP triphosphohydrolase
MSQNLQDQAMRPTRVRFSVRWLMITVAVVAFILGGTLLTYRRYQNYMIQAEFYSQKAEEHEESASFNVRLAMKYMALADEIREAMLASEPGVNRKDLMVTAEKWEARVKERNREAVLDSDRANHLSLKADAFRHAATRPWVRVSTDPPDPE